MLYCTYYVSLKLYKILYNEVTKKKNEILILERYRKY